MIVKPGWLVINNARRQDFALPRPGRCLEPFELADDGIDRAATGELPDLGNLQVGNVGLNVIVGSHQPAFERIFELTHIDPWFLAQVEDIIREEGLVRSEGLGAMTEDRLRLLKRKGFSDARLGRLLDMPEKAIRQKRQAIDRLKAEGEMEEILKKEKERRARRRQLEEEMRVKERQIGTIDIEINVGLRRLEELKRVVNGETPYVDAPPLPPLPTS